MGYVFKWPGICEHFHQCNHTQQAYDQVTVALAFNYSHIIYYHTDVQWSMGLAQTYLPNPNYLGVQYWGPAMYLSPDIINQIDPHTYHYTTFLRVW